MNIKATVKHLKISPKKVRLVANLIRGLKTDKALAQLQFTNKGATKQVTTLLNSAIANAVHNYELDAGNLFVKEIRVDEGATLKRWMPRAHGRATPIRKRTSHINLVLGEIKDSGEKEGKKSVVEKPINLEEMVKQSEKSSKKEDKAATKITDNKVDDSAPGREAGFKGEKDSGQKGFVNKIFRRKSG